MKRMMRIMRIMMMVMMMMIMLSYNGIFANLALKQYRQSQQAHDPRAYTGQPYALTTSKSATVLCRTDWKEETTFKMRCNEVEFD